MVYVIRRLEVSGFLGYRSRQSVEFGRGVTAIIGENGAGKSSLVDAVSYLLSMPKKSLRGATKQDMVNRRSIRALIRLHLESSDGDSILVEAEIPRSRGGGYARLVRRGRVEAVGLDAVRGRLASLLGMPPDRVQRVIDFSVVIRQAQLEQVVEKLASQGSRERLELLQDLFGVTAYKEARERLGDLDVVEVEVKGSRVAYTPKATSRARLHSLKRDLERELEAAREEAGRLARSIEGLRRERDSLRARVGGLREREKRLLDRLGLLREYRERAERLEREVEGLRARLEEESRRLGLIEKLEEEARSLEEAASYRGLIAELDRLSAEAESLKSGLAEQEALVRAARAVIEYGARAEEYERLRLAYEGLQRELGRLRGELHSLESQRRRYQWRVKSIAERARGLLGRPVSSPSELEAEVSRLRGRVEGLEREAVELESRLSSARARARDLREARRLLLSSREPRCPLCGSSLGPGEIERLAEELGREAERLEEEARMLEERLSSVRRARDEARRLLEGSQGLLEQWRSLEGEAPSEAEVEEVRRRLQRVEAEARRASSTLRSLEAARRRYEWAVEELARRGVDPGSVDEGYLRRLEGSLESARREALEAEERVRGLEERILGGLGARDVEEARRIVGEAEERLARVREELRALYESRARVGELRRLLEERERELEEARARLEEYGGLEEEYRAVVEELRRAEEELDSVSRELAGAESRLEGLRELEESLARSLESVREAEWRLAALEYLRSRVFEEAPARIMASYIAELESRMGRILSLFNLEYTGVSISVRGDDVEFRVISRDGSSESLGNLSGGEKTAVALSFILAVHSILAERLGFLVLDEPTTHLDDERRRVLVDIFKNFRGGRFIPQLIVVTHDAEIKEAADEVYEVRRGPEGSVVGRAGEAL